MTEEENEKYSDVAKKGIHIGNFKNEFEGALEIAFALDDRQSVVNMYLGNGINAIRVNEERY